MKTAQRIFHNSGYRRFCRPWWRWLGYYVTSGWWHDIQTFWHRGRYGWAPRDTWSLDDYLAEVLAGSLAHLAMKSHGSPACFPHAECPHPEECGNDATKCETNHAAWEATLYRWALAFREYADRHDIDLPQPKDRWAEEARRYERAKESLRQMSEFYGSLWD